MIKIEEENLEMKFSSLEQAFDEFSCIVCSFNSFVEKYFPEFEDEVLHSIIQGLYEDNFNVSEEEFSLSKKEDWSDKSDI